MSKWVSVALKRTEEGYLDRHSGSNIFRKQSAGEEDQIFHIENPDHNIFAPINDHYPHMVPEAVQAIRRNRTDTYDELDIESGYIIVDGEKIEFESSTKSEEILSVSL